MMEEKFDVCVDDSNVEILDFIRLAFENGWHKHYEVTVSMVEFDYDEDGDKFYVEEPSRLVNTGLSNSYGAVTAIEHQGSYYMLLDNYGHTGSVEISRELYLALNKEFN